MQQCELSGLILEKLEAIVLCLNRLEERMDRLEERMDRLEERMDRLEERMDRLEERMDRLEERVDRLEEQVAKNYQLLEEFYVHQKEFNTAMLDRFAVYDGRLEMQGNQIARNTSIIKAYYPSGCANLAEPA